MFILHGLALIWIAVQKYVPAFEAISSNIADKGAFLACTANFPHSAGKKPWID